MLTSLSLLVPGLLGHSSFTAAIHNGSLPALDGLFAGVVDELPASMDYEQQLIALLGGRIQSGEHASIAHLLAGLNGVETKNNAYLLASPVHLQADSGRLLMYGDDGLDIDESEAQQWLKELSPIFAPHHIEIDLLSPECWLLRLKQKPDSVFTAPSQVIGEDIHAYMPNGHDGSLWRSLINEIQMQLHQSPVNATRQAKGLKAVNSLWFWGEGDPVDIKQNVWQSVVSDDALARLIAKRAGITKLQSLAQGDQLLDPNSDYQLVVDTSMLGSTARQDFEAWYSRLNLFQDTVAKLVLDALKGRQLKEVQIYPVNGFYYRIRPSGFGKIFTLFRKKRDFASYLEKQ